MSEIAIGILISTLVILSAFFLYFVVFPLRETLAVSGENENEKLKNTAIKKFIFAASFLTSKFILIGLLIYLYKKRALINIRDLGGAFLISSFFIWSLIVIFGYFYKPYKK